MLTVRGYPIRMQESQFCTFGSKSVRLTSVSSSVGRCLSPAANVGFVSFFLENERMSLVQTPHHFYNPDPFERNLYLHNKVPYEGALFYHRIQAGLDFWNSTFFCGSCAVLRRTAE